MKPITRNALVVLVLAAIGAGLWFWLQHAATSRAKRAVAAQEVVAADRARAERAAASAGATTDGSKIIVQASDAGSAAPATARVIPGRDAAWHDIQQTGSLRVRINQAQQSNDPQEAAAAMNALIYCSSIASRRAVTPADAAEVALHTFAGQDALLRRSNVQRRADEIETARKRCSFGEDPLSRAAENELRRNISSRMEGVNDLVRRLRQSPGIDGSALTAEDRAMLASGRLDVLSSVLGGLGDRWAALDEAPVANDVAAQLARHLVACRLGDACGQGSFRFAEVCVALGGCEGGSVEQAIERLVADEPTRQRMQRLTTRIEQQLAALAKR